MTFSELNRLKDDRCEQEARLLENQSQFEYTVSNGIVLRQAECGTCTARQKPKKKQGDDACATSYRFNADGSVTSAAKEEDGKANCVRAEEFALKHPSMHSWSGGPGAAQGDIDVDSRFKNESESGTHAHPQQLPTRVFKGAPYRRAGNTEPVLEAKLLKGHATKVRPSETEETPSEKQFPTFHPTLDMPATEHVVSPWPRAGRSSRDITRSSAFLKMIGYKDPVLDYKQRSG